MYNTSNNKRGWSFMIINDAERFNLENSLFSKSEAERVRLINEYSLTPKGSHSVLEIPTLGMTPLQVMGGVGLALGLSGLIPFGWVIVSAGVIIVQFIGDVITSDNKEKEEMKRHFIKEMP